MIRLICYASYESVTYVSLLSVKTVEEKDIQNVKITLKHVENLLKIN